MSRKCDEWFEGVKRVPRRMSSRLYNWGVKGKRDGYIQTEGGLEEREDEYFLLSGGREEGSYLDVPDRYFSLREDERDALVERITGDDDSYVTPLVDSAFEGFPPPEVSVAFAHNMENAKQIAATGIIPIIFMGARGAAVCV